MQLAWPVSEINSLCSSSPHQSGRWIIPTQDVIWSSSNSPRCPVREQTIKAYRKDLFSVVSEYCAAETAEKCHEVTIILFFFLCERIQAPARDRLSLWKSRKKFGRLLCRWKVSCMLSGLMYFYFSEVMFFLLKRKAIGWRLCKYKCTELTMSFMKEMNNVLGSEQSTAP